MPTTLCGFNNSPGASGRELLVGFGPTLMVRIGFDPTFDPEAVPVQMPNLPQTPVWALVDTGAVASCIDSTLAMNLNLPIIDRQMISGVHGRREVNVHLRTNSRSKSCL